VDGMSSPSRRIVPKPKALNCPNCGSAIELRALGAAASVVCSYCTTTLDATNPQLTILQKWKSKMKVQPLIPLGARGKLQNTIWEAIGFQQRGINVDGTDYFWREYVLFNPYKGFRYLSEYENHWNFITPLRMLPQFANNHSRPAVTHNGRTYDHFQTAQARTWFVIGEFPWRVEVGETVNVADYTCPPYLLSSESTKEEVAWSAGEYTDPQVIWSAFQMKGSPPSPNGIFANQPNPHEGKGGKPWKFLALMAAALFVMMVIFAIKARNEVAFNKSFTFNPAAAGEKSFVTDTFELKGDSANVQVDIETDLSNSWVYFALALINEQTGQAYDFGREVSYYSGSDSDGSWTEGSTSDDTVLPAIPGGRYYLRIEPESDPVPAGALFIKRPVNYSIKVTRDVPYYLRYFLGMLLLLIPIFLVRDKGKSFENQRWLESDYGTRPGAWYSATTDGSEDDDE
jgi:hypothetical protein